jgi:hypothetical protein
MSQSVKILSPFQFNMSKSISLCYYNSAPNYLMYKKEDRTGSSSAIEPQCPYLSPASNKDSRDPVPTFHTYLGLFCLLF